MGASRSQGPNNQTEHFISAIKYIMVPEMQYAITLFTKPRIADHITRRFKMLTTIDLDHELRLDTNEISDIGTNRMLATKTATLELASAQVKPKTRLGVGHAFAQLASKLRLGSFAHDYSSSCVEGGRAPPSAFGTFPRFAGEGKADGATTWNPSPGQRGMVPGGRKGACS